MSITVKVMGGGQEADVAMMLVENTGLSGTRVGSASKPPREVSMSGIGISSEPSLPPLLLESLPPAFILSSVVVVVLDVDDVPSL